MQTIGLGGDSHVDLDESSNLVLSSARVIPVSMLATLHPAIESELLAALGRPTGMRSALDYLVLNTNYTSEIIAPLSEKEARFIQTLDPDQPNKTEAVVNGAADRACVRSLADRGILRRSGFTPSDAAHVLGLQDQWSNRAALAAAELLGRAHYRVSGKESEQQVRAFCQEIFDAVVERSTHLILSELSGVALSQENVLVNAASKGRPDINNLGVRLTALKPIVAVGGPALLLYPEVGKRLQVNTIVPKYSAVANALGAALGIVRAEYCVEITLNEAGGYLIHAGSKPERQSDATKALSRAKQLAKQNVRERLEAKGGKAQHVSIHVNPVLVPDVRDDSGLISAVVTASCDSLPQ